MKEHSKFRIVKDYRTWVVARKDLPYEYHAHFKKKSGCFHLIHLYNKGIKPNQPYFREAMQRITTQEEWKSFREEYRKDKFFKKQKHMLRR